MHSFMQVCVQDCYQQHTPQEEVSGTVCVEPSNVTVGQAMLQVLDAFGWRRVLMLAGDSCSPEIYKVSSYILIIMLALYIHALYNNYYTQYICNVHACRLFTVVQVVFQLLTLAQEEKTVQQTKDLMSCQPY